MPYLCYLYILYYLPSPKIEETKKTNKAPRNGIVRGLAILATYKFIMYTLYGTYKMSARFNPSSSTTLLLRQSIDLNVMSLFNKQLDYFKDQLDEHIDNTQKTIDKSKRVYGFSQKQGYREVGVFFFFYYTYHRSCSNIFLP